MRLNNLLQGIPTGSTGKSLQMDAEIGGVCFDSRSIKPGDLFIAVRGSASDGHQYIGMALEKGASAVLCEEIPGRVRTICPHYNSGQPPCSWNGSIKLLRQAL